MGEDMLICHPHSSMLEFMVDLILEFLKLHITCLKVRNKYAFYNLQISPFPYSLFTPVVILEHRQPVDT